MPLRREQKQFLLYWGKKNCASAELPQCLVQCAPCVVVLSTSAAAVRPRRCRLRDKTAVLNVVLKEGPV